MNPFFNFRPCWKWLRNVRQLIGKVSAGSRRWQRSSILTIELNGFFYDLAEFFEDDLFVVSVTSTV